MPSSIKPLESPTCRIHASSGRTEYAIDLRVEKRVFATIGAEMTDVDVRLATGTDGGTMTLTRDGITLTGEVNTNAVMLESPFEKLFDDWLEVRGARVVNVDPDGLLHAAIVRYPYFVAPVDDHQLEVPCKDGSIFDVTKVPAGTKQMLKDGTSVPLRTKPGGATVANIVVPSGTPYSIFNEVIVLERKGTLARVRIGPFDQFAYGWGWIDGNALVAPQPLFEQEREPIEPLPFVRCDHDVSIYVHVGDHPLKVGFAKKGAKIPIVDRKALEPIVDLRLVPFTGPVTYEVQRDPLTEAFVTGESVADCR